MRLTPATDSLLDELEATTERYEERSEARAETKRVLAERGILYADDPQRVTKRLQRLNCDWTLAKALAATPAVASSGRSLDEELPPESFGADVLGLERLMGRNDLIDVGFLERGHLASRSVGRITVRTGTGGAGAYGTGFLISPRLLLTNNHVLHSPTEAERSYVEFDYQAGLDGLPLQPVAFALAPAQLFVTDAELDFSVVAVEPQSAGGNALERFGFLRLIEQEGKVVLGELVNVIQHPNGEPKQLALRENEVVDLLELFLHYETDTSPGSSGSPVLNDQWEVVALHHSGVPKRDETGAFLAVDGSRWTRDMGEHRLAWKANEGVRISRVLRRLREHDLTGGAAELRAQVFEAVPAAPAVGPAGPSPASIPAARRALAVSASEASARLTVPLEITVSLGAATGPGAAIPVAVDHDGRASVVAAAAGPDLSAALVDLEASRRRTYYAEGADRTARELYYDALATADPDALRRALSELLERTHTPQLKYQPLRQVYPWVDLHPDRKLRSIYSGKAYDPEQFIHEDAEIAAARTARLQELALRESMLGPAELEAELIALEAALPYNCEHVVPQSSFAAAEPMRGDLHHLFACESNCNSFRGNTPYFDFADFEEKVRHECGRREPGRFEPGSGKGAVARATMYFLLRYPGVLGDEDRELQRDRLPILLDWHAKDPVGVWERHRNAAIAELQGNRNPLIDHPEWAERLGLEAAFG